MNSLLAAIMTRYTAAGLSSTFTGGIYLDGVPKDGASFPFIVATVIAAPVTESYGGTRHYTATIQFQAFHESDGATNSAIKRVLTAMETFIAAFDDQTLTVTGGTNIDLFRENDPIPIPQPPGEPGVERNENANDVCGAVVTYQIAVQ